MKLSDINDILREKILQRLPRTGDCMLGFGGAGIYRRDESNVAENCFYRPLLTITIQGSKWSTVGGERFYLSEYEYLVATVDMPAQNYVVGATSQKPFLSMGIDLDKHLIAQLISENPSLIPEQGTDCKGAGLAKVDTELLGAFLRLLTISENPREAEVLSSTILKEIHLRLLMGPLGKHLCGINTPDTAGNQVARAISWLRKNFREPLTVSQLSGLANMSAPSFHRHFRRITKMSPLQYQKHLRLYEAQRLMLMENETASNAAYAVGYESPTQFSREYKRLFGNPPRKSLRRAPEE